MELVTFDYTKPNGWSVKDFPPLDSPQTLVLVFGGSDYIIDNKPFRELASAYPDSYIVGCSSAGEIFQNRIMDDSLSVAVVRFQQVKIDVASILIETHEDSFHAGEELIQQLKKDDLQAILIFSDGLNVNGTALVNGIRANLNKNIIVTGGLAGDGGRFKQTWVLRDKYPETKSITAVGLYGESLLIGYGSKGGWDIFGPERIITRSNYNVLYEIDDQPALALYKNYLGDRAAGLPGTALLFPLAIRKTDNDEHQMVRTILSVNEADQSMTFAGDVPEGWICQLMKANFDRIIQGATEASHLSLGRMGPVKEPLLAIAISCVGRRLMLGGRTEEELESVLEVLPKSTRQIGFYSYGEISPSGLADFDLHNQTMTLTIIGEK